MQFSHFPSLFFPTRCDFLRRRSAVGHCLRTCGAVADCPSCWRYDGVLLDEARAQGFTDPGDPALGSDRRHCGSRDSCPESLFLHERVPYEASSVRSLRAINTAEVEYARTHPDKGFASSIAQLGSDSADLIDSVLASGRKSGYIFVLTAAPPDSHGRISHYTVTARPQKYGKEGKHSFLTDVSGALHH